MRCHPGRVAKTAQAVGGADYIVRLQRAYPQDNLNILNSFAPVFALHRSGAGMDRAGADAGADFSIAPCLAVHKPTEAYPRPSFMESNAVE